MKKYLGKSRAHFEDIDRRIRFGFLYAVALGLALVYHCQPPSHYDLGAYDLGAFGTARSPLVYIGGKTEPLPAADYLATPGGLSTNARAAAAGDIETSSLNGIVYAAVLTDVGLQAAIDAAPSGGQVDLLPGATYVLNAALPIIVSKPLTIDCHGWGTLLQVAAGVSGSTPVFLLRPAPATTVQGMTFRNCRITPASGTPASSGFVVDGTNGPLGYLVLDHVRVDQLGSFAVAIQNAGSLVTGTPYDTTFTNASILTGGANLTNVGDSVVIDGATEMGGTGSLVIAAASPGTSDQGAHGFLIDGINMTLSGGVVIQNATQGAIRNSDFEAIVTSTEANDCLIDIQGNGTGQMQGFELSGNYLGANSAFVGCTVRVDRANDTRITKNFISPGSVNAYTITANAIRTRYEFNVNDSAASPAYISDLGTATSGTFYDRSTGVISSYGATVNYPALDVGTTNGAGGIFDVNMVNSTHGNEPSVWTTEWAVLGQAAGANGKALGVAVSSSGGAFITAIQPGVAYIDLTINTLATVFQLAHTTVATIDNGCAGSTNCLHATVPLLGTKIITGGLATPSQWTNGAAGPPGTCAPGDLYTSTGGGVVTTLYVCTSANTWTAK